MPRTIEIVKGSKDYLIVSMWTDDKGNLYVSTGVQYLNQFGEKCWTKKGFALRPKEAREYAAALLVMAEEVENALLAKEDEEYDLRGEWQATLFM